MTQSNYIWNGRWMRLALAAASSVAAVLAVSGCGSNASALAERSRGEAEQWGEVCKRGGVRSAETLVADSLMVASAAHLKEGQQEPARRDSEWATAYYRLALARRELADMEDRLEKVKKAMAQEQDKLQTYREILQEMKAVRKP